MSDIQSRIIEIRKKSSLSQLKFAEKLGKTRALIAQIETYKSQPTIDLLVKIVSIFNTNLDWLILGNGNMYATKNYKIGDDAPKIVEEDYTNYSKTELIEKLKKANHEIKVLADILVRIKKE
jgi:transcriptional regulator with XRE-family HTH domain